MKHARGRVAFVTMVLSVVGLLGACGGSALSEGLGDGGDDGAACPVMPCPSGDVWNRVTCACESADAVPIDLGPGDDGSPVDDAPLRVADAHGGPVDAQGDAPYEADVSFPPDAPAVSFDAPYVPDVTVVDAPYPPYDAPFTCGPGACGPG